MWTGYPHAQPPNPSSILAGRQAGFFLCAEHDRQLGGAGPLPTRWRRRVSEAQGRRREAGSEGSVEQNPRPDGQEPDMRPTRPDEQASDCKVQGHQGPGWQIRRVCGEGGRSYLGRSVPCPEPRTEPAKYKDADCIEPINPL